MVDYGNSAGLAVAAMEQKETGSRVANREGGAHVDPLRDEDLRQLEEENTMGFTFSDPLAGADQPYLNGPTLPSVRQVAYKLQTTLEDELGDILARG